MPEMLYAVGRHVEYAVICPDKYMSGITFRQAFDIVVLHTLQFLPYFVGRSVFQQKSFSTDIYALFIVGLKQAVDKKCAVVPSPGGFYLQRNEHLGI